MRPWRDNPRLTLAISSRVRGPGVPIFPVYNTPYTNPFVPGTRLLHTEALNTYHLPSVLFHCLTILHHYIQYYTVSLPYHYHTPPHHYPSKKLYPSGLGFVLVLRPYVICNLFYPFVRLVLGLIPLGNDLPSSRTWLDLATCIYVALTQIELKMRLWSTKI